MKIAIRKTKNLFAVLGLNDEILPYDPLTLDSKSQSWLVTYGTKVIGFCCTKDVGYKTLFLSRSGILKKYRGKGIHRRMIKVRERFAKAKSYKYVITYVHKDNPDSFASLIRLGYELYTPEYNYAGSEFYYFRKELG